MRSLEKSIIGTLTYFDIFNYPLKEEEIMFFLGDEYIEHVFQQSLDQLIEDGFVFRLGHFYSLRNDESLAERRMHGNQQADRLIVIARKVSKLLVLFPFVRGIGVSGSLSKNFADDNSDIDFFIITAANRLWICRTLMHILKKLSFLIGKENWFCMNYYIDEQRLTIKEKNIYTAIEVASLLPLKGIRIFDQFHGENSWAKELLPNYSPQTSGAREINRNFFKRFAETLFNNRMGNRLESHLMNLTTKRWKRKSAKGKLNDHGALMAMDASKFYAKPDPSNFQEKILNLYNGRKDLYTLQHSYFHNYQAKAL